MFDKGIKATLKAGESLLSRAEKLTETIERKSRNDLGAVIRERVEADAQLSKRETAAALGEDETSVQKARARIVSLNAKIDEYSSSLSGLRDGFLSLGGDIGGAHGTLRQELPAYATNLTEAFEKRWSEAVAAWSKILGERRALESLIGSEIKNLTEPLTRRIPAASVLSQKFAYKSEGSCRDRVGVSRPGERLGRPVVVSKIVTDRGFQKQPRWSQWRSA